MKIERKTLIAERFNRRASVYNEIAGLQYQIARRLADFLPRPKSIPEMPTTILELGCGTGFLTGHLLKKYPGSNLWITDIAKTMVQYCQAKYSDNPFVRFAQLDGEYLQPLCYVDAQIKMPSTFDLILSSMVMQWFEDPGEALRRQMDYLNKNGRIYFATLGNESFHEWRKILTSLNLPAGTIRVGTLPGILAQETISKNFGSGWNFLQHLKAIGARTPSLGYQPISTGELKRALTLFDEIYRGQITWHIVYGCIDL